ncbi:uncharacterized protein LOC117323638 [Pecten maximus]|uniref:uncharacterized protein LOC117323638 n=1 Tax=Pecten maximus TaxID=6579 RepID=UPI00145893F6|nr:uncharacterized protein LOC117323638 [Pecten maximus]
MDAAFTRLCKDVNSVCYGQQGKEFCIKQPPINATKFAVILVFIYLIFHCLHGYIAMQLAVNVLTMSDIITKIYFPAIGVFVAAAITTILFGIQIQSESLVFVSSIGVNVKMKNWFGQVTADFFEISEIKDIVILEAITMQRVVCYLAVVLKGSDNREEQLYPLFMKSSPDLETLKVIYRDVHQLLQDSRGC